VRSCAQRRGVSGDVAGDISCVDCIIDLGRSGSLAPATAYTAGTSPAKCSMSAVLPLVAMISACAALTLVSRVCLAWR
jgi:hypothetical protein